LRKNLNIDIITKNIQYDILINTMHDLTDSSTKTLKCFVKNVKGLNTANY